MSVRFPAMRNEVIAALRALADRDYQERVWVRRELPSPNYHDDLDLEVHVLFDDVDVCVDPDRWVGDVLEAGEVAPFRRLGTALGAMIDDLGNAQDADYLADPRWSGVIEAATAALAIMGEPSE